jgi:hypothetical protein
LDVARQDFVTWVATHATSTAWDPYAMRRIAPIAAAGERANAETRSGFAFLLRGLSNKAATLVGILLKSSSQ